MAGGINLEHVLRRTEYPAAIRDLIAQLRQMPGVGPRSAERIALWMVRARGDQPEQIARAITDTRAVDPCLQFVRVLCYRRNLRNLRRPIAID